MESRYSSLNHACDRTNRQVKARNAKNPNSANLRVEGLKFNRFRVSGLALRYSFRVESFKV